MEIQTIGKFFINPLLYFFLIITILLIKSSLKLKTRIYILIFIYLFSIPLTSNVLLNIWSKTDTFKKEIKYDGIIVLAGGTDFQWYIKKQVINELDFNFERFYKFKNVEERIFTAIEMVKNGIAKNIFYSNWVPSYKVKGKTLKFNCSEKMQDFSLEMGIPKRNFIIYGDEVKRTIDEAKEFNHFLENKFFKNILLITSQSHMRRALGIFKNQNILLDHYSVSKVDPVFENILNIKFYMPNLKGLRSLNTFLYEFIGFLGYLLLGKI